MIVVSADSRSRRDDIRGGRAGEHLAAPYPGTRSKSSVTKAIEECLLESRHSSSCPVLIPLSKRAASIAYERAICGKQSMLLLSKLRSQYCAVAHRATCGRSRFSCSVISANQAGSWQELISREQTMNSNHVILGASAYKLSSVLLKRLLCTVIIEVRHRR